MGAAFPIWTRDRGAVARVDLFLGNEHRAYLSGCLPIGSTQGVTAVGQRNFGDRVGNQDDGVPDVVSQKNSEDGQPITEACTH